MFKGYRSIILIILSLLLSISQEGGIFMSAKLENAYQAELIKKIKLRYPGVFVLLPDPTYIQGIPDILILFNATYALLEVKAYEGAPYRPNQEYYIGIFNDRTFAETIYPENELEVLTRLDSFIFNHNSTKGR